MSLVTERRTSSTKQENREAIKSTSQLTDYYRQGAKKKRYLCKVGTSYCDKKEGEKARQNGHEIMDAGCFRRTLT